MPIMRFRVTCSKIIPISSPAAYFFHSRSSPHVRNANRELLSASCNRGFTRRLFICSARVRTSVRAFPRSPFIHSERGINTTCVCAHAYALAHAHAHAHIANGIPNDPVNSRSPPLTSPLPVIALLPLEGLLFIYGIHPEIQFGTCACSLR